MKLGPTLRRAAAFAIAATLLVHAPRLLTTLSAVAVGRASDHGWLWLFTSLYRGSGLREHLPFVDLLRAFDLSDGHGVLTFVAGLLAANLVLAVALSLLFATLLWLVARDRFDSAWTAESSAALGIAVGGFAEIRRWLEQVSPSGWATSLAGWVNTLAAVAICLLVGLLLARRFQLGRRSPWPVAVAVLAVIAIATGFGADLGARAAPAGAHPNVLLISIDSLRSDHLQAYGYERNTSPVIESLAREGVLFETVVAPTSWTLPSHLTMMTGLSPETHGVVGDGRRLSRAALTLAEVFRSAGYATAGFVSGPYLRAEYGFYQGFEHYDDYTVELHQPPLGDIPVMDASHRWITGPPLAEAFTTWLERWNTRGRDRPFFAFVHQWDVHYDYVPPAPHDTVFDPDYGGTASGRYDDMTRSMSERDLAHVIALYDGEIRFTDELLEKLLGVVRRLGVLDDTIVVLTADHGEEFYEHGGKGHRHQLYDESILVPLVLRYPAALPAGVRVDDQVRLMDLPHTVLELAAVDSPDAFGVLDGKGGTQRGRTLVELIGHPPAPPLPAFGSLEDTKYFLRTGRYKFLLDVSSAREEVYDLQADPGERINLASSQPELTTRLRGELQSWLSAISDANVAEQFDPGEHHREQLRNLGYIE